MVLKVENGLLEHADLTGERIAVIALRLRDLIQEEEDKGKLYTRNQLNRGVDTITGKLKKEQPHIRLNHDLEPALLYCLKMEWIDTKTVEAGPRKTKEVFIVL